MQKEKMKSIGKIILILFIVSLGANAQKTMTLKECLNYSNTNNSNIKIANYNVDISDQKITEAIGGYLPQINASGGYDNNLMLSTQLLPGVLIGKPAGTFVEVTFGTAHNASLGFSLTQKLFDASSWLGIKTAEISKDLSNQTLEKTNETTIYNISVLYYQALVIQMQMNILKSTLVVSEESLKSIELKYSNGMAKKIDVDKIKVSFNNTKSQLQQAELNYQQSLNNLKFQMGMPVNESIVLADTVINDNSNNTFQNLGDNSYKLNDLIDYRLQETNLLLSYEDKRRNQAAYLPTLSFYGNYNFNAMRKEFNFFDTDEKWFKSSAIGLKLSIPIFSGGQRYSKVSQSEIGILKAEESIKQTEQSIRLSISNYQIRYNNALSNINNEKANLDLAESVYKNTQLEYKEGASTTLDLVQSESALMVAQNSYFNKLLELYIARIELEKAKGTLKNFINNL